MTTTLPSIATPPAATASRPFYTYRAEIADTHHLGAGPLRIADDSSSVLTVGHGVNEARTPLKATTVADAITEATASLQAKLGDEHTRGWTDQDANWSTAIVQDAKSGSFLATTPDMTLGEAAQVQGPEHTWWGRDRRTVTQTWTPQGDGLRAIVYGTGEPVVFDGTNPYVRTSTPK